MQESNLLACEGTTYVCGETNYLSEFGYLQTVV